MARSPAPGDRWLDGDVARWLSIAARTAHLVSVSLLAASLLGAEVSRDGAVLAVLASGVAMFALDLGGGRIRVGELAGAVVVVKLAVVGWLLVAAAPPAWGFWALFVVSSLTSHAPKNLRHWAPWR